MRAPEPIPLAWRTRARSADVPDTLPVAGGRPRSTRSRGSSRPSLVTHWRQLAGGAPDRPRRPAGLSRSCSRHRRRVPRRSGRSAAPAWRLAPVLPGLAPTMRSDAGSTRAAGPRPRRSRSAVTATPAGRRACSSNSRLPPSGYELEFDLGSIQLFPKPGTRPLVVVGDGSPRLAEPDEAHESFGVTPADPFDPDRHDPGLRVLGLFRAGAISDVPRARGRARSRDRRARARVGSEDPLSGRVVDRRTLGFIEPYPIEPRHPPACDYKLGLAGLLLGVDQRRRRHEYAVGTPPEGELVGELGSVLTDHRPGLVRLRREPGGLVTSDGYVAPPRSTFAANRRALDAGPARVARALGTAPEAACGGPARGRGRARPLGPQARERRGDRGRGGAGVPAAGRW